MRISDWSSDVCSSDLDLRGEKLIGRVEQGRLVPYLTRKEIEAGALAGRGLELAWAADPVDAFFLHVQGSGRVVFPDGRVPRVGFAGSNGHPFYAIGRPLHEAGIVSRPETPLQKIPHWLRPHPEPGREAMPHST